MSATKRFLPFVLAAASAIAGSHVVFAQTPVTKCTVATRQGVPLSGTFCGGSTHGGNCSAGAIYSCKSGPTGTQNNCTLSKACAIGCLTSGSSSSDSCFTGTTPLAVSPLNTPGGSDLSATLNLAASHPGGAYVNLKIDRGDLVPGAYCAPPFELDPSQTSAAFGLSSAVVSSAATVHIYVDLAYSDSSGRSRELVSVPQVVTLNPGGTAPPTPPLTSFTLTPSSIGPAGVSFMDVVLSRMAPAAGVGVSVTSSDPSTASVITNGQPFVLGSCLTGGGAATLQAANTVSQTTTVTVSASTGALGQAPLTQPLTVTSGCVPNSCTGGPSCGPTPNGCGGTMNCGCTNLPGQTCGGGGVPNQCGPFVLAVSTLTLQPSTVISGSSSVGTVTLNGAAPSGGALVTLDSTNSFVQVPGSITVPAGQASATFTATTTVFTAGSVMAGISAAKGDTVTAYLTVNHQ